MSSQLHERSCHVTLDPNASNTHMVLPISNCVRLLFSGFSPSVFLPYCLDACFPATAVCMLVAEFACSCHAFTAMAGRVTHEKGRFYAHKFTQLFSTWTAQRG